jgi:hypothetical protein
MKRPRGITALAIFFVAGALISATAGVSLLVPNGPLEPMWRINPKGREAFATMGAWGPALLAIVCAACATAAIGSWRLRVWGYRTAVAMFVLNLVGDIGNVASGREPRALVGIPIVVLILFYLSRPRVRAAFTSA